MRTAYLLPAFFVAGALLITSDAHAQLQFAVEPRAGVTFPMGDLSDGDAEAGLALGAELMVTFARNLTAYVGVNRHSFNCDNGCDFGDNPRSSGVGGGLKVILPSPPDALIWARGGVVANRFQTDEFTGDREIGFEAGVGVDFPILPRTYLVPHLGLVNHSVNDNTARYALFGVGLHYHFN